MELGGVCLADSCPNQVFDPRRDPGPISRPMRCRFWVKSASDPELAVWRFGHGEGRGAVVVR